MSAFHVTDNGEAMKTPSALSRVISYIPYGEIFVEHLILPMQKIRKNNYLCACMLSFAKMIL